MKAYSVAVRERVIGSWQKGRTQSWIAQEYEVGLTTVKGWLKQYRETGRVEAKVQGRMKPMSNEQALAAVQAIVDAAPDATLAQYIEQWANRQGRVVSPATMSRALKRANRPRKKDAQSQRTRRG
jgi:transposase